MTSELLTPSLIPVCQAEVPVLHPFSQALHSKGQTMELLKS